MKGETAYYIIIRGSLGSGKTSVSKELARLLDAKHISIDEILDQYGLSNDREERYISLKSFLKANEIILPEAEKILKEGKILIIEGNFYYKAQIEDLTSKLNYPHYVFTLKVPLEVCIERDHLKKNPHGEDATRTVYAKVIEFDYGFNVDDETTLEEGVKEILEHLPKRQDGAAQI